MLLRPPTADGDGDSKERHSAGGALRIGVAPEFDAPVSTGDRQRRTWPDCEEIVSTFSANEVDLATLRIRIKLALHDKSRPLPVKMAEYRLLLRESRLRGSHEACTRRALQDSF